MFGEDHQKQYETSQSIDQQQSQIDAPIDFFLRYSLTLTSTTTSVSIEMTTLGVKISKKELPFAGV